jgi:hypothetical protein
MMESQAEQMLHYLRRISNNSDEIVRLLTLAQLPPPIKTKVSRKKFKPPTVAEVREHCTKKNLHVDAQSFIDFYASKGWKVGNAPMTSWPHACQTWARRENHNAVTTGAKRDHI